ncbi:MAG: electron transfer flavoprotein subunit beta/FixA family protein [Deltaproteobacteria bacterium]|nr:electron transfer flavoprotein subunit beta/FixA family protein [Candidatus Anaeroferrophillus wilburensis]MBN2889113.1 electron transfer flavoprotein subunit beta/FixA family protein [Deltaproteobacteria bacterium]
MGLRIIVTVKQVPDTHNVSGDAMKEDGTVNRAALPAIFNPEDLNALEEALKIKEAMGGTVTCISMGPPNAAEVLKECLYRGADDVILVSDRRFAGADTLATSYALKCAIEQVGEYDLILCGRQAIDGDTAQVGPQIAEKLAINQLTCVGAVVAIDAQEIAVRRLVEDGSEIVKSRFPVLLTVTGVANEPRSAGAKRVMAYKNIGNEACAVSYDEAYLVPGACPMVSHIKEWNLEAIGADPEQCGFSGSPTKVKKIQSVVLTACESKLVANTDAGIGDLMHELIEENIIG